MNDSLFLIISILIAASAGAFLGMKFIQLKSKSDKSMLEERQKQSIAAIEELKQNIVKIESEREEIRRD